MISSTVRKEIAARLRGLIAGQDGGNLAVTAQRLGVEEVSLRMSIDELSPFPTLDVLTAVVSAYGVDPTYIVSGQYDVTTHRRVLDDPASATEVLQRAVNESRPIATPTDGSPILRLA